MQAEFLARRNITLDRASDSIINKPRYWGLEQVQPSSPSCCIMRVSSSQKILVILHSQNECIRFSFSALQKEHSWDGSNPILKRNLLVGIRESSTWFASVSHSTFSRWQRSYLCKLMRFTTYNLRGQDMLQQPKVNTTTYIRTVIMKALSLETLEQATKQIKSSRHLQYLQNSFKKDLKGI